MDSCGVPKFSDTTFIKSEKYNYTGTVHSNYVNKATKELVSRSSVWKANSLNDYTFTTYVAVTPSE